MELSHLYSKPELCELVALFNEENKILKEQIERWEKTQEYIEKNNDLCRYTLYKEIYELKEEIKKLKKDLNHLF